MFRPLIGWATAWSFDRLRLRIESGVSFEASLRFALVYALCRGGAATAWLYHGLVPKLLWPHAEEAAMLAAPASALGMEAESLLRFVGCGEVLFGALLIATWGSRLALYVHCLAMVVLAAGALATRPAVLLDPFNPFTLNLSLLILGVACLLTARFAPSAGRCLRRAKKAA